MAKRESEALDNFAYVQAMKRVSARSAIKPRVHQSTGDEMPGDSAPEGDVATADTVKPAATPTRAASRVAVPTKRLVICYACGYSHTLSGRMHNSLCPKCKTNLLTDDVTVSGKRTEDILTIGNVMIGPEAEFDPRLRITGQNVILDGDVRALASITATESLEIRTGAKFEGVEIQNKTGKVVIAASCTVALDTPFVCDVLDIYGHLKASVKVANSARLYAGSFLEGSFHGPTLLVDEGAGLVGDVDLSPLYKKVPAIATPSKTLRKAATVLANALILGLGLVASFVCCVLNT